MKNKAYKFKLKPNSKQKELINKTIGCCRLLYNKNLSDKQDAYQRDFKDFKFKTEKQYKEEFNFLKEVDSIALQQARLDLHQAYKNHFR